MPAWVVQAHRPSQMIGGVLGVSALEGVGTLMLLVAWGDQQVPLYMMAGLLVILVMPIWLVLKVVTREVELTAEAEGLSLRTVDQGPLESWDLRLPWSVLQKLSWTGESSLRYLHLELATEPGRTLRIAIHDRGEETRKIEAVLRDYLSKASASSLPT